MDTRVKERLVGAAVLVGIIVALVPEMLSGPRHDSPPPASGDQVRTYTIDLSREAGAGGPPREVVPSDAPARTAEPPMESEAPGTGDAQANTQADSDTPSVGSTPTAPADEPSTQPPSTAERPAAAELRNAAAKPEIPAASVQPQSRQGPALDSGWAVQLGSFANRENAERLAGKMRQRGYRAFVSRHGSGNAERHRVRVGPEQDRSRAEALAQRLRRDGQQVSIVEHP